jgi:hypothetical protein
LQYRAEDEISGLGVFSFFPTIQGGFSMTPVINNTAPSVHCQVAVVEGSLHCSGSFSYTLSLSLNPRGLDEIINKADHLGQEIKRSVSVATLEAADG